ncbi:MAG TPA: autotransporter domain-containing protein [Caulobacteraceae bacterium]|jgi:outer membrane autotransporter protein|nr:autotransporter domain-containing protein [Caulobacteraceae bacterium]
MRRSLFAAAALGPIVLAFAAPAFAATVSNARTTPIATSGANNGAPDDVTIDANGSIKLTAAGAAVVLDSNNAVTNAGTIQFDDASNATGVLIQGGTTGAFTNTGAINVIENYTPVDSNADGVFESPLASGSSRYGVRVVGASPFVGSLSSSGNIFVEGNASAGISVEAPLQGSIFHTGTIGVTGDNAFGLRTTAPVSGEVLITGPVSVSGTGSVAASLGDIGGPLRVYSSLSSNGFSTSVRSTVVDTLKLIQATPSEQLQSGPALVVGGDVAGGILLGATPVGTVTTDTTTDKDADGIIDSAQTTASVVSFGSAPALLVGGAGRSVSIGAFGTGANAYGLIVAGGVSSQGLYDGVSATGAQIGGTGSTATLAGGVRVSGSITATAYEAASTALRLGAGAVVPELRVENSISASLLNSAVVVTPSNATATAVQVQAGGALPTLNNYGFISANAVGPSASATAVADLSGSLTTVNNQGQISASLSPSTTGGATAGRAIALDLRANTTGVTLTQTANPSPIVLSSTTDSAGVVTVTGTTPVSPAITGDVLLGSGPNTVSLQAGTLTGALDLGSAASSLSIDGGAVYTGFLAHTGPGLTIGVANGTLTNTNPATLQVQTLNVGAAGTLSFAVDSANARATRYQVTGAATLATGSKIGINLLSGVTTAQSYTLISSPALNLGSVAGLTTETPYVVIAGLRYDQAAGTLNLDVRRRTAAEAQFDAAQTAAYDPISKALPADAAVQSALFAQQDRASFLGVYNQMLPDYSGGAFRMASLAARAVSRVQAEGGPAAAWVQEITVGARQSSSAAGAAYRALGFGIAGGLERDSGLGVLGVKASFTTGDSHNPDLPGDGKATLTDLGAGVYWRASLGGLRLDAGAGAGYVRYTFARQLLMVDSTGVTTLSRTASAKAGGWSANARAGVAYQADLGALYLRPQAHLDYYRLTQGGYAETGGGDAFDLTVARRNGHEASATASLVIGASFGHDFTWRPELEVGYRSILSSDPGVTQAHFTGGDSFSIYALGQESGGAMGRLSLKAGNELYDFSLSAGAEQRNGYLEGDAQIRVRLAF